MSLRPVLLEALNATLQVRRPLAFTPRDARSPEVQGKVHAVIGMRRAGKTTFLRQLLEARGLRRIPSGRSISATIPRVSG